MRSRPVCFTCAADNRIRESQHLTLIHDRTNLSFGRSRRAGLFDRAPPIRLQIRSLSFGQDMQHSDGGKKKFWDTQCMCDVLCCVALRISLQSPSAVHFRAVTNIDCQDDARPWQHIQSTRVQELQELRLLILSH